MVERTKRWQGFVVLLLLGVSADVAPRPVKNSPRGREHGTASAPNTVLLGLNPIHYLDGPGAEDLARQRQLRAAATRLWVNWREIEPTKGLFQWKALDEKVRIAREQGLEPWALVAGSPRHACRARELPEAADSLCPPRLQAYRTFLRKLADRYRGQIRYYEIWNEPDIEYYWTTGPQAQEYAELLLASYQTIKPVDRQAQIVMGATAGTNLSFLAEVLGKLRGKVAFDATAATSLPRF